MALRLAWLLAVIPTLAVLRERGDAALAGPSAAAQALAVGAGAALIVAAAIAPAGRIPRRGLLAAAGGAWLATEWANPAAPGALIFTAGVVAAGAPLALVLASTRAARAAVALAVAGAVVQGLGAALAGGPGASGCFDCPRDLLALASNADPASRIGAWTSLAACAAALATLPFAFARAPRAERVQLAPVAAFAAATAAELAIGLRGGAAAPGVRTAHLAAAAALVALALGACARPFLLARARRAVAEAITAAEGGAVAAALAPVVGDPSLALAYALPDGGWVDAGGRPVELPADGVTLIGDEGEPIAALLHEPGIVPDADLVAGAAATARLRLDAERLEAVVLARVEQLRQARRRVVEAAEDERRRLERDLHDGAQQRLVALRFALGLARARADGRPASGRLAAADAAIESALAALRDLAHGLYPPSLDADGLAVAVRGAAERARVAVAVGALPDHRLAPAVERAAYRVILDALALAERAGAGAARIEARDSGGRLELRVQHDGGPTGDPGLLADRVGALGGVLAVEPERVVAELPCG